MILETVSKSESYFVENKLFVSITIFYVLLLLPTISFANISKKECNENINQNVIAAAAVSIFHGKCNNVKCDSDGI
jgi:hypothetical protein